MIDNVYICLLQDGKNRIVLQPFIELNDNAALQTVKNAIREDGCIRAVAMQERVSLHKVCEIVSNENEIIVESLGMLTLVGDNEYFNRYAKTVYADEARQKANEAEAEVMADSYMKGEIEND